ncbi:hypothetical protein [Streptomyces sp. bgisy027]|uniref:hypothetical protein n=1 Tax=unclassified Streptomyces TaxID=2593676 RepID=UPI003D72E70F
MNTEQAQTLLALVVVLGMFVLLALPSLIGAARDRRIDRQIREAQERDRAEAQKSSSRSTVPSTATWYADGRRSKKLVSS